jgi:hypothetical protein
MDGAPPDVRAARYVYIHIFHRKKPVKIRRAESDWIFFAAPGSD